MPLKSDELDMTEGHLWVEFTPGSLRLLTVQCHSLNQCLLRGLTVQIRQYTLMGMTVIYIYVCGQCRTQFMLSNSSRR